MELMQLRYFLEVAETQHITQSAQRLHIAQPALSQSIHRLESDLGVPLFTRKGRNIVLTQYGKYLQSQLLPIIDQLDKLPKTLQSMAKLDCETIHLNVLAASTLITKAIIKYGNRHKNIKFQLFQNTQSDAFDIEVTTRMFYQIGENEKNTFVCPEKIFLAVPNNERYAGKKTISLKEVADENFISLMGSKQFRYICDKFCHHYAIKPHITFESDSPVAVRDMIASNLGIGFWPEFTWGKIKSDKVLLLELEEPDFSRDIIITYSENKADNRFAEDFFSFFKKVFPIRTRCR